jgi:hypothetical protein
MLLRARGITAAQSAGHQGCSGAGRGRWRRVSRERLMQVISSRSTPTSEPHFRSHERLSDKPKRLYEIDNDSFRRPRRTASGGRSGLSASEKTRSEIGHLVTDAQKVEDPKALSDSLTKHQVPSSVIAAAS